MSREHWDLSWSAACPQSYSCLVCVQDSSHFDSLFNELEFLDLLTSLPASCFSTEYIAAVNIFIHHIRNILYHLAYTKEKSKLPWSIWNWWCRWHQRMGLGPFAFLMLSYHCYCCSWWMLNCQSRILHCCQTHNQWLHCWRDFYSSKTPCSNKKNIFFSLFLNVHKNMKHRCQKY